MAQVVGGSQASIGSGGSGVRPGSKPERHRERGQSRPTMWRRLIRGTNGTTGGRPRRPPRTAEADATEPEEDGTVLADTGTVLADTGTAIGAVSEAVVAARVWARQERLGGIRSNDNLKKKRTQGTASQGKERGEREQSSDDLTKGSPRASRVHRACSKADHPSHTINPV